MKTLLSIILFVFALPAIAQNSVDLTPLPGPEGAFLRKVIVSGDRVIALGNSNNEFYEYTGGGWQRRQLDPPILMMNDLASLPGGEFVALVYVSGGKSELWNMTAEENKFSFLCKVEVPGALATDRSGAIALMSNKPQISLDHGATWLDAGKPPVYPPYAAVPMGNGFAAITLDSVYAWSPLQGQWTNLEYPIPYASMRSIFYANDTLYVGSDLGLQARGPGDVWRDISYDLEESEVRAITKLGQELIVLTPAMSFASTDNGDTWERLSGGATGGGLAVRNDTVIAWNQIGSYKRASGGEWLPNNQGLHYLSIDHLFSSSGDLIAGVDNVGVLKSTDGGKTWQPTSGIPSQAELNAIVTAPDGNLIAGLSNHGVYRSTDNGSTWSESAQGLLSVIIYSVQRVGDSVLAFAYEDVFVSTNSGVSWSNANAPDTVGHAVTYEQIGDRTFWGGYEGLWTKTDNETRWTRVFAEYATRITRAGSNLIAGYDHLYVSRDNGTAWQQSSPIEGQATSVLHLSPTSTIAGTTYGLRVSRDSGVTWSALSSELDDKFVKDLVLEPLTKTIYVGTDNSGIYKFAIPAKVRTAIDAGQWPAYPNPSQGLVNIAVAGDWGEISYAVIDALGRSIMRGNCIARNGRLQLDLS
jgi:hypothetical protein